MLELTLGISSKCAEVGPALGSFIPKEWKKSAALGTLSHPNWPDVLRTSGPVLLICQSARASAAIVLLRRRLSSVLFEFTNQLLPKKA